MRKIYNFLSSVKLAVAIFFLLASGSIAGTLIEQGLSPEEYITRYGEKTIQVNDPLQYKGIWFYQNGNIDPDTAPQYSELQIAKDPGVNIVWAGSGLLMVGLLISFFIFHRRLWISIVPSENRALIYIGGISNKDTTGLETEMDRLINDIQSVGGLRGAN